MDQMNELDITLPDDVRELIPELVALRRKIHRHPELGFKEHRTKALVEAELSALGLAPKTVGKTGVVADIRGDAPGQVLLIRGDMDALPIEEQGALPFKSETPGVMHACGHDAHTAMLLTTARILTARGLKKGTVKLMFQPAEEGEGGALAMIRDGVLENPRVDGAIGFHVWSGFDVGKVAALHGAVAASVDGFRMVIKGKGVHAATPEDGIDPVVIAAEIITAAQALVTRRISARDPVVLSFTSVHAGNVFNIIPETAEILGTFRTLNPAVREGLRADLMRLANAVAEVFGATVTYETLVENKPTMNAPKMVDIATRVTEAVVGQAGLYQFEPPLVGEDFSEVLDRVPGVFVILGCRSEVSGAVYPHHHPRFTIDERVLPIGVAIAVRYAEAFLGS